MEPKERWSQTCVGSLDPAQMCGLFRHVLDELRGGALGEPGGMEANLQEWVCSILARFRRLLETTCTSRSGLRTPRRQRESPKLVARR